MEKAFDIPNIRIITISGRIASGSTTLAKKLAERLKWQRMEGGDIFWEAVRKRMNLSTKDTALRPDEEDLLFEKKQKEILENDKHLILESKLAGFVGKDMKGLFRILVICEDTTGTDQTQIRIDRLVNREGISVDEAKIEVLEREQNDIEKWRRLYADNDPKWTYWDHKYYDLVINTFSHNEDDSLALALDTIGVKNN